MPYRTPPAMAEHKAEMRARLLAAAQTLFATQGYAATTMQQVVKQAGTSIGNCYFYFPDKASLLLALFEEQMQSIGHTIDQELAQAAPGLAQLAIAVYLGVVQLLEAPEVARIALIETSHPDVRDRAMDYFVGRVRRVFAAHAALLPDIDPDLAAHAWQGASSQVVYSALVGQSGRTPDEVGRFVARWNLQALGLTPDSVHDALDALDTYRQSRPGQ